MCFLYLILWLYIPFSIYLYHVHYQTNMKPLTPQSHKCNNHVPKLLSAVLSLFVLVLVLRYDIKGEPLILILSLTSAVILLFFTLFYWRFKASDALFYYALSLPDMPDRARVSMQAVWAGNPKALWVYAFSCPDVFDPYRPLTVFRIADINCVFFDYYFPSRFHNLISYSQWQFARTIYYFKEGKDVCGPMFVRACRVLPPASDFTFMFMPCSSERRYYVRFSALSDYLTHCFQAESGIDFIIYTGTRESKHTSSSRSDIDSSSNYIINAEAVSGRNVIIVDDLLTTGESLKDYARTLTSAGATVLGAVFLGKTFSLPSRHTLFLKMFFRSLFRVR